MYNNPQTCTHPKPPSTQTPKTKNKTKNQLQIYKQKNKKTNKDPSKKKIKKKLEDRGNNRERKNMYYFLSKLKELFN